MGNAIQHGDGQSFRLEDLTPFRKRQVGRDHNALSFMPFAEWNEMFPNSGCVVTLIDRLIHRAEIIQIDGDSYRLKEAKERQAVGAARRKKKETKRNAKATATKK